MAPQLQTLLDRLEALGHAPDSIEAQRLHRNVRARLLDETVLETRIARFVVTHRLGVGGMGVVYAARDTGLDREVAIKLVRNTGALDRDVDQQRLIAEARALAQLSHPNVVAIYDVGLHRGRVFIAMELVRGKTLRQWVHEPRTWQTIVEAYVQAAAGLAAAHRAGLVHRDFKPDNVLIDETTSRVRVVDFGLAVGHDSDGAERTSSSGDDHESSLALTATGKVVGTPAYMAPEQLVGARADARSDQFGFCVALWEALFGERPFLGDRTILRRGAAAWVPRPPQHPERAPGWLRDVLVRGLAYEPSRRWPSMDALALACRRPPRSWRRWIAAFAIATTAVLGVLGARAWHTAREQSVCDDEAAEIAAVWNGDTTASTTRAFAATELAHAGATARTVGVRLEAFATDLAARDRRSCTAHRVDRVIDDDAWARRRACIDEQRERLATVRELFAAPDRQLVNDSVPIVLELPSSARCEDDARLAVGAAPPGSVAEQHAAVRRRLARARQLAIARRHEDALARAIAATEEAHALGDPVLEAEGFIATADALVAAGNYADAAKHYERAYFVTAPLGIDEIAITAATELVVVVGVRLGHDDDGLAWARHAEALLDRIGDHTGADAAELAQHTAHVLRQRGDHTEAKTAYERSIALRSAHAGADHPAVATAMVELASLHGDMLEIPEALRLLEDAERIVVAAHGEVALPLADVLNVRCTIEAKRGRYADALPHCRRALEIREARLEADHPDVASALSNMSSMLMATGDADAGREALARAIEIRRARLGPMHPSLAAALSNQGVNLSHAQDWPGAIAHLDEALEIRRATLPANHHHIATTLINLAEIELWRARFTEAEALAAEAAAMTRSDENEIRTIRGRALACVGMARLARGDHEGAIVALEDAVDTPYAKIGDPAARCEVHFRLAEALLPSAPTRAARAATAAREPCTEGGPRTAEVLAAVDAILRGD